MSGKRLELRPGAISDVYYPPTIEQVLESMRSSRLSRPLPLALMVPQSLFGGDVNKEVTVPVVPTALRLIFFEEQRFEFPEYEFEGWVLGTAGLMDEPRIWVSVWLRVGGTSTIEEASIRVLAPGQEQGTKFDYASWDRPP
jgi:hypothetical protein